MRLLDFVCNVERKWQRYTIRGCVSGPFLAQCSGLSRGGKGQGCRVDLDITLDSRLLKAVNFNGGYDSGLSDS